MKITLTIDTEAQTIVIGPGEPLGELSRQDHVPPSSADDSSSTGEPGPAETPPGPDDAALRKTAARLLAKLGVNSGERILRHYCLERIIEVCQAAQRKGKRIKKPAGYVCQALQKGWAV